MCCLSFYLLLLIAPLVSFGHCVVCPSSTYSFLLPLWYLLVIVLSVLLLTPSYCPFGIFWSLCCLSFYLLLLIASLVSFGHCVGCPFSTYSFLLPLWYLLVIVLSVLLLLTPSYCFFGIFWSLCWLSFFYLLLLIASLVSFGHCVVCSSSTYSFLLPLWYILVIVLSVLLLTPSYCPFGIFWSLCCLSFFYLLLLIAPLVSFGHCVVCPSTYSFLLPLWYLLVIVLSVLLLLTPSYCPFGIFWSLCRLSFDLLLLIAPLVSFGHCVVCPSTYSFLLPLWYLLVIVLAVLLLLTPSYCLFGIFWSLCCLSFFYLLLLIASLVSFGHCVVCPSTYSFLLTLWYLLVIVLSVLLLLTPSYCLFGIFWSLCWLSFFYLLLLIASLVSFGHCVVCPSLTYSFLLPLWYLLVIVSSVLLLTPSYCLVGIFWSLCCLSFFYLLLLIASLVSFGHCVVCPSPTYSFLLPLWYLLVIVLSVLLLLTPSYCLFGIFWSLCCLSFFYLLLLIASLVSFGHCVVCPSSTYSFLLSLWYLLVIVSSVLLLTPSYCLFGIFWSLCCLSFFYLLLLIASLVSFGHCVVCPSPTYSFLLPLWYLFVIVSSVLLLTPSYCLFGIFWSLCCLSFYLLLLIAPLVSFGHCVVCPSSTYSFLLSLWYILVIVLSVLLLLTPSYCLFGIFWSLCCLSFYLLLLIAPLVSFGHCVVCPSSTYSFLLSLWYILVIVLAVLLLLTPSYCPLVSFGHCVVCPSSTYSFLLLLWYLLAIVLSVLLRLTPSYCLFGIFWSLCCLSFFYLLLLIASLVSFGHCVVCPSTYSFLLPLWYLLVIVLSVLLLTPSYCPFGIFWSLCCLSFYLLLLIASLVSFGHCVVCPSSTYSFLFPLWYLLDIVLAVLLRLTPSYCFFGIFWSLCCLSFFYLLLLIASLVSFGHCVVCPSTYSFLLSLWYLLVIVLSILLLLTPSYCLFGIFWSLCRLSFFDLLLLIAPLVFFGHCVVCPSTYSFLLPRWYLLVIVLSVLLRLIPSYCLFGIFWSLCRLSFYLLLLIASLVSFGHCVVCPSTYSFLLPLWYILVNVLSVLLLTPSYCLFGIFWSLCCLSFFYLLLLIVSLVSFGHCVVCPSSTYSFLLSLWYILVIVLSVLLLLTPSYCLFGIFWSLCRLSFYLLLLIASLVSFGHCVVCPSSTYSFLLSLWYILVIVLSVLLLLTPSYCLFGIFWSLCRLSFYLLLLIASLVSFGHCVVCPSTYSFLLPLWYLLVIVLSVLLLLTPSYCLFGIFWSLCCLSFFYLLLLIAALVSFGHCVVCPSTYSFLLPLWYLLIIVLSVLLLTPSYCPFGIFWSLCCLSFFYLLLLIAPLVSFGIVLSVLLLTPSYCPFGIFWSLCCLSFYLLLLIASLVSFGHCVGCPFSTYSFLLPLWYLLVIVLSVLLLLTPSYCFFGIFWSLCWLSFFYLLLLIASLVSFGHCVVCPSSTYSFLLPLWYILVIVLSVLLLTPSYCPFGIFWSLCCLSFYLLLLIAPLVSFGHCVVCPSSTYSFLLPLWYLLVIVSSVLRLLLIAPLVSFGPSSTYSFLLPLWYLLVIVLAVLLLLTPSYCLFGIFWSLCRLSFYLLLLIASLVSFGHCVVCPSTYSFLLPLWYLLVIVLSVLLLLTPSYCLFGIFWSLCCLSFFYLLLLIAALVSFGHCVVCPSTPSYCPFGTYSFLLPLWYLLVIVLSVLLLLTPSYCPFGIFWSLCCLSFYSFLLPLCYLLPSYCLFGIFWSLCWLSFFYLLLLIASLVSFGHCVVCPSSTYSFLLLLWYLLVIVLAVLLLLTPSYCLFGIFWPLCCLSFFYLLLLIAPLVYFGHCVVCPSTYSFLLPLWYLLVIVLSVLLLLTPSYCPFGIFWSLCCLSFYLLLLIAPLVSFGHCVVCPSSTYSFLLPLWYLLVIVSSVLRLTPSYCPFGIFWSLCCLSFYLLLFIAPLVSFGHCVGCPSSTYSFLLPLWYLLVIVLSVLLLLTPSYCLFGIFWSLCRLSFYLLLLIDSLVSFGHCVVCPSSTPSYCLFGTYSFLLLLLWYLLVIVSSVLRLTPSYCPFGIFWSLCRLSFYLLLLIASLVSFGHCVVCPFSTYSFLLPLWYLLAIVLSVLLRLTPSYCLFGIFWSLCCLSFFYLLLLIAPLVSFGHCVVCPSSTYSFLLPLWYLLVIVSSVLRLTPSYCPFGIFWSLCCLSFYLLLFIAPLVSFGHCVGCPSSTYSFLLPLWYLLVIVLSVLLLLTPSYCLFGIFWSLCRLSFYLLLLIDSLVSFGHCVVSFFYLLLLIASLVSFGHCVGCPSSTYSFLLPLWYLLVIVLSVLLRLTPSYCFGIFWPLCCLSFSDLLLLIASLVSFGHCVVYPSSTYSFLLLFGIFWPLCCLSFFDLLLLIASLVSFGHCVVCPSTYSFLLPRWYLLVIVFSVLLLTPSYCLFGIFWSLCCLSFFYLLLLIAPLVSFGHCVVCPSTYSFLLPLWYLLVIVLSVLLLTPSYCLVGTYSFLLLLLWYLLVIVLSVLL